MSVHAIICKRTGLEIASKLDGGTCVCNSADDCIMRGEWDRPDKAHYRREIAAGGDDRLDRKE